jgi:hypothetical protein
MWDEYKVPNKFDFVLKICPRGNMPLVLDDADFLVANADASVVKPE